MTQSTDQPKQLPSLAELFSESDRIGDKYVGADELSQRDADLAREIAEIAVLIKQDKAS